MPRDFWKNTGATKDDIFPQIWFSVGTTFALLENLDLTVRLGDMGSSKNPTSPVSQLIKLLSSAPKLESLRLHVRRLQILGTASIHLTRLFEKVSCPNHIF